MNSHSWHSVTVILSDVTHIQRVNGSLTHIQCDNNESLTHIEFNVISYHVPSFLATVARDSLPWGLFLPLFIFYTVYNHEDINRNFYDDNKVNLTENWQWTGKESDIPFRSRWWVKPSCSASHTSFAPIGCCAENAGESLNLDCHVLGTWLVKRLLVP